MRCVRLAFAAALLSSCGAERSMPAHDRPTITVMDGVAIVDNPGLRIADTLSWSIDTTEVVRIGVVDGPEEDMIGRLAGMLPRPDGTILIADAIAHQLRVFDGSGRFVRSVGRAGEGPGEYGWMTHILPHTADSVVVMDNEASRANVLDPQLEFVRRFRPRLIETRAPSGMTSHRLIGFFEDGTMLVSDYLNVCGPLRDGFCEDSVAFYRTDEAGATLAWFGRFVYSRRHIRRGTGPEPNVSFSEPHPQAIWRVYGERFYYADAKRFEILVYGIDGSLERVIRVAAEAPRFQRDDVLPRVSPPADVPADSRLDQAMAALNGLYETVVVPDPLPFFSDMLIDVNSNLWLREFVPAPHRAEMAPRWFVFDPDGRLTHAVRSPASMIQSPAPYVRLRPWIGDDRVLARVQDEYGVESVVVYLLRKRG